MVLRVGRAEMTFFHFLSRSGTPNQDIELFLSRLCHPGLKSAIFSPESVVPVGKPGLKLVSNRNNMCVR